MAKARSRKSVGFLDDAVNFVKDAAESVVEAVTPDEGTLGDKIINPKKYRDKAITEAEAVKPKPKPVPTTPQTKNPVMARDEKRGQGLSKAQAEEIRKRLKAGEKVSTEEYQ
jgi:hypothetical protein